MDGSEETEVSDVTVLGRLGEASLTITGGRGREFEAKFEELGIEAEDLRLSVRKGDDGRDRLCGPTDV